MAPKFSTIPTVVTDATSSGLTKVDAIKDRLEGGPKPTSKSLLGKLEEINKKSGKEMDKSSRSMGTTNDGVRKAESADAKASGRLNSITTPTAPTTAAPVSYAPQMSAPQMAAQTAAPMIGTMAQMPMMAAQPAAQAAYALTPAQQAAILAASTGDTGGAPRSNPLSSITGGTGYHALANHLASQNIPYAWGGGSLEGPTKGISDGGGAADAHGDMNKTGFDCSGLSRYMIYKETGVEIPRTSEAQYAASVDVSDPKPGDLVFPKSSFNGGGPGHVQIYLGDGKVIHAPQSGDVVRIDNLPGDAIIRRPQGVS